ncbi:uncharacterized protein BDZ99DRAFT_398244 [Mytilinidion resinicola]|uniref:ABM domain-containing protein n=1 Tax=Mytilinidion resinicola TaxID=574789 RepID=A0A6A6Y713_9PEZI|nr:uncharacterized protein BDZ99DRAFT_398244 [Mytilinidion resinicola]KAF2804313.1 hypothetical protein BDZ99DRAFT_398244 [Mytilinidion resinicola]
MSQLLPGLNAQATITIKPEDVPTFLKELQPIYEKVTAEPQCISFEVFQSTDNPGVIHLVENWTESVQWFMEVQAKKEYYKAYFEAIKPLFVEPLKFQIFNRLLFSYKA